MPKMSVMTATGARARVRAELTAEILTAAKAQLAEHGSAALSRRAVAREVGMVSSAVYRYFPSRDQLLTALIVDAYDSLGEAAERGAATATDLGARWHAICTGVRGWALDHPHEYALIVAWSALFGMVSFELFGQFHNVVDTTDAFFVVAVTELARFVGIPADPEPRR